MAALSDNGNKSISDSPDTKRLKTESQFANDTGNDVSRTSGFAQEAPDSCQMECKVQAPNSSFGNANDHSNANGSSSDAAASMNLGQELATEKLNLFSGGVKGPLVVTRKHAGWCDVLSDWERRSFVAHLPNIFTQEQLQKWFQLCDNNLPWEQPSPVIPRGACWLVVEGCKCSYDYAAVSFAPAVMADWFLQLTYAVCDACGITDLPNSCNANRYDSGMESVGWHADSEYLFDATNRDALIVSLSLGASRKFELRPNRTGSGGTCAHVTLSDGDLCTMEGLCQKHYQHCVPKEFGESKTRINLTWRWLVNHTADMCPLAQRGPLGEKLREISKAKQQLKWKQLKKEVAQEEQSVSSSSKAASSSSSVSISDHKEKMRLLQKQLGSAKKRLAELKRKRGDADG